MSKTNYDELLENELQDPVFRQDFQQSLRDWDVALRIVALRQTAGLTQRELATKVGTTQQVISRLESADYRGHSLTMLRRLADALDAEVIVDFRPRRKAAPAAKKVSTRKRTAAKS